MIKYTGTENKYLFNQEDIDIILNLIKEENFFDTDDCTREKISAIVTAIDNFISNIKVVSQSIILERHETEEEAREYFGQDFINQFDHLLTTLNNQDTIVALHGTNVDICPKICDTGLQYKSPSLNSTAVTQDMNWNQSEMHYDNYEMLLNWRHREYKGLVILAIPYECYYKEGLWNHFQESDIETDFSQDYRIDPDFVVGYIDVIGKKVVMNPKYNRQHNYSNYEYDRDVFVKRENMDNEKFRQAMIKSEENMNNFLQESTTLSQNIEHETTIDISRIPYIIEELKGEFNSIKYGFSNGMNEEKYKSFLAALSYGFNDFKKIIPLLKTDAQVKKDREEIDLLFNQSINQEISQQNSFSLDDWGEWGSSIEWDNESEKSGKSL